MGKPFIRGVALELLLANPLALQPGDEFELEVEAGGNLKGSSTAGEMNSLADHTKPGTYVVQYIESQGPVYLVDHCPCCNGRLGLVANQIQGWRRRD